MKSFLRLMFVVAAMFALASCATSKFKTYDGPAVTSVQINKTDRKLYLLNGTQVLKTYTVALGYAAVGPKQFEGDGKTPEGTYTITHRNPDSVYHLSLGISYPNAADVAFATAEGKLPGDNIFIHGGPTGPISRKDWTVGCIAVTNREIEQIYAMVNPGTPITIFP